MMGGVKRFCFSIAFAWLLFFVSCSNSESCLENSEEETAGDIAPDLEWTWVPYDSDVLRISGRTNYEKGDFVILSWSSSMVTIAFEGTALEAKVWTNAVFYLDVFVDGEETPSSLIAYEYSGDEPSDVSVVSGLPYGKHLVTLYKRSESNFGDWYFYGLRVLGRADKELLPKAFERKIEFVGNSITCGSDVLMLDRDAETDPLYESAYYGYAGQTAWILGAEIHNICSGGHGLAINYDGSKSFLLPVVYENTGTKWLSVVAWDHDKWHPDVVVINLGTNDFASGMVDSTGFVNAAIDFVQRICAYHPKAKIVILDGPMLVGENMVKCRHFLDVAKATLESMGVDNLYRFSLEPKGESPNGIYYHPNREESLAHAESLSAWMRSKFGWN